MSNLIFGLSVTVIGMLIVFFGLVILIFCVKGMNMLFGQKKQKKVTQPAAPAPAPAPAPQAAPAPAAAEQDDSALAAVIAAAIAAVWQDESTGFVVRRIRRVNNASPWQKAGREEQTYSRL